MIIQVLALRAGGQEEVARLSLDAKRRIICQPALPWLVALAGKPLTVPFYLRARYGRIVDPATSPEAWLAILPSRSSSYLSYAPVAATAPAS